MNNKLLTVVSHLTPFETVEDVVNGLELILKNMVLEDRRRVFLQAYLIASKNVVKLKQVGYFEDANWVSKYSAVFGDQYRQVIRDYESRNFNAVPKVWQIAFDRAKDSSIIMPQHLALGMNAHLGRDLPYAITEMGKDDNPCRYRDHNRINDALKPSISEARLLLCKVYSKTTRTYTRILQPLFVKVGLHTFHTGRELAWKTGKNALIAKSIQDKKQIWKDHEEAAILRATKIVALSKWKIIRVIRRLENN